MQEQRIQKWKQVQEKARIQLVALANYTNIENLS